MSSNQRSLSSSKSKDFNYKRQYRRNNNLNNPYNSQYRKSDISTEARLRRSRSRSVSKSKSFSYKQHQNQYYRSNNYNTPHHQENKFNVHKNYHVNHSTNDSKLEVGYGNNLNREDDRQYNSNRHHYHQHHHHQSQNRDHHHHQGRQKHHSQSSNKEQKQAIQIPSSAILENSNGQNQSQIVCLFDSMADDTTNKKLLEQNSNRHHAKDNSKSKQIHNQQLDNMSKTGSSSSASIAIKVRQRKNTTSKSSNNSGSSDVSGILIGRNQQQSRLIQGLEVEMIDFPKNTIQLQTTDMNCSQSILQIYQQDIMVNQKTKEQNILLNNNNINNNNINNDTHIESAIQIPDSIVDKININQSLQQQQQDQITETNVISEEKILEKNATPAQSMQECEQEPLHEMPISFLESDLTERFLSLENSLLIESRQAKYMSPFLTPLSYAKLFAQQATSTKPELSLCNVNSYKNRLQTLAKQTRDSCQLILPESTADQHKAKFMFYQSVQQLKQSDSAQASLLMQRFEFGELQENELAELKSQFVQNCNITMADELDVKSSIDEACFEEQQIDNCNKEKCFYVPRNQIVKAEAEHRLEKNEESIRASNKILLEGQKRILMLNLKLLQLKQQNENITNKLQDNTILQR